MPLLSSSPAQGSSDGIAKEHGLLTCRIVGFGTFGQFLAKRLVARGHRVLATSRTPYDAVRCCCFGTLGSIQSRRIRNIHTIGPRKLLPYECGWHEHNEVTSDLATM
jgi:hypothetical protein